ncbi:MAG: hypothetical protein WBG50_06400 [Desulfomonilaceae bacterium]
MGVNAEGQTIRNPIDAFCLVPGTDPPRFVMATFTITDREYLKHKWLFDTQKGRGTTIGSKAEDGDLVKAARKAEELRRKFSQAEFVVHLCTNQRVDDELMGEVYEVAKDRGLQAVILAQSRIRDCLDTKPEGQWLRKEHLGIEATMLSLTLLIDLSKRSLTQYGREFPFTALDGFVTSEATARLAQSLQLTNRTIHVVIGASGFGKSVASYQVLQEHIDSGCVGLWIPADFLEKAVSIEQAIDSVLRSLHPMIQKDAGAAALRLAGHGQRLLFVVDDMNRGRSPTYMMRKIVGWARPFPRKEKDAEDIGEGIRWAAIVPLWDIFWAPLDDSSRSLSWLGRVPVGPMTDEDAVRCLSAALGEATQGCSQTDLEKMVETLGHDPILMALFAELVKTNPSEIMTVLSHRVMERYVDSVIKEAATSGEYLPVDYTDALATLSRFMLQHRKLYPLWSEVKAWLTDRETQVLTHLTAKGQICRVYGPNGRLQFEFRHDRILEYHLCNALALMTEDLEAHAKLLSDPFYASFLGCAMATCAVAEEAVQWISNNAPTALFSAIRFLKSEHAVTPSTIVKNAKEWLKEGLSNPNTLPAELYECCYFLEITDSSLVLEITDAVARNHLIADARLANGDALSGVLKLASRGEFWPAVTDRRFDTILDRALHRHSDVLISDLKTILGSQENDAKITAGALTLAGYFGFGQVAESIWAAWDSAPNRPAILIPALWAAMRCGDQNPASLLHPMIEVWSSLSDEETNGRLSEKGEVSDHLRFAMRRGISKSVLKYLVDTAIGKEEIRRDIVHAVEEVDHPVAIAYVITVLADIEHQAELKGGVSPWTMFLRGRWDPLRETGKRLSAASIKAIKALWEEPRSDDWFKKSAFEFWVKATDDLAELQTIPPANPHFHIALWRRALLGDFLATSHVRILLLGNKRWFHVVAHIWSSEFREAADKALAALQNRTPTNFSGGRTEDHHMLAKLLRDIPSADAEELLAANWGHLRFSPRFVQVAFYLATERSIELGRVGVEEWPASANIFEHVGNFFGFFVQGLSDQLTLVHLEVLRPYLERLDDLTLLDMAQFCESHGYRSWAQQHLRPEIDGRRAKLPQNHGEEREFIERVGRRHFPTNADLLEELDLIEQQRFPDPTWHWREGFEQRQDNPSRWRCLVDEWLASSPSVARLRIVADVVRNLGRRKDLDLLIKYEIDGSPDELERIRKDTQFTIMRKSID